VDITGENHYIPDSGLYDVRKNPFSRLRVTVPLIGIEIPQRREDHLLSDQAPARPTCHRCIQLFEKPLLLGRTEHLALGCIRNPTRRSRRFVARLDACVEHHQIGEVPKTECAVNELTGARIAHRHPLMPGADRHCSPCLPSALACGVMVACSARPGIVGGFVVIPYRYERMTGVAGLQRRITAVKRVTTPVILEADDFVCWIDRNRPATDVAVLVDIVTEMDHRIEIALRGNTGVCGVASLLIVRTRHHRQARLRKVCFGQRTRMPHRGLRTVRPECIKIIVSGLELIDIDLAAEIVFRRGHDRATTHDMTQLAVARNQPFDRRSLLAPAQPRPYHHRMLQRIAAGNAVQKQRCPGVARVAAASSGSQQRTGTGHCHESTPIQPRHPFAVLF